MPVDLDIQKTEITADGVKDFAWPFRVRDIDAFGLAVQDCYLDILHDSKWSEEQITPYKFLHKYFINEAIGIFRGDLLRELSARRSIEYKLPSDWRLWPALLNRQTPDFPAFVNDFVSGPKKTWREKAVSVLSWLSYAALIFNCPIKRGIIPLLPPTRFNLAHKVMVTQNLEVIQDRLKKIPQQSFFCRSHRWFHTISVMELREKISAQDHAIMDAVMKCVRETYENFGIELLPHSELYLRNFLERGSAALSIHYARLMAMPRNKLPATIWTGTGGNAWDALLRYAVRARGGASEGHDHAGVAYIDDIFSPLIELWGCDRFYTYNKTQAEEMRRIAAGKKLIENKLPEIDGGDKRVSSGIISLNTPAVPRNILYITTLYDRDRGRIGRLEADLPRVDLQARLLSWLKAQGYAVTLRPHPESPVMPPPFFREGLGVEISTAPFMSELVRYDMVIFDYVHTTTFHQTLETDMPVVIIDLEDIAWTDTARPLIEKRIPMVKAAYTTDNRFDINFADIEDAIARAPAMRKEDGFVRYYYL